MMKTGGICSNRIFIDTMKHMKRFTVTGSSYSTEIRYKLYGLGDIFSKIIFYFMTLFF